MAAISAAVSAIAHAVKSHAIAPQLSADAFVAVLRKLHTRGSGHALTVDTWCR
jgi:hypothetical protein